MQRQPATIGLKASTDPLVSGAALTSELSNQAYPESNNKRTILDLFPVTRAASTGATPVELFIGGKANFRFRAADQSTVICKILGSYTCSVGANDTVFEITLGITNRNGTVIILANGTNVKMPTASTAALTPTIVGGNLVLTGAGVVGDINGRWNARLMIGEVTDVG